MSNCVLDASALLALLNAEPGASQAEEWVTRGASISTVNLSEVIAKLVEAGMPEAAVHDALDPLGIELVEFDVEAAYDCGFLRSVTRQAGLLLGDRACLALARRQGVPAITTDRAWTRVQIEADVVLVQ